MVAPDSGGVPSGGKYGNVPEFIAKAGKNGLSVCWSTLFHCFGIYTRDAPGKYTFQLLCRYDGTHEPIPLTDTLLWLMLHLWRSHCNRTGATLERAIKEYAVADKQKKAKEQYEIASDLAPDVHNETMIQRGKKTRKLMSIPPAVNNG